MLGEGAFAAGLTACLAVALASAGQGPAGPGGTSRAERLQALHTAEAATYAIYRDPARAEKLELRREPVLRWSNPTRNGGQEGDVFVWTYRGRPEVIASIFSHPAKAAASAGSATSCTRSPRRS